MSVTLQNQETISSRRVPLTGAERQARYRARHPERADRGRDERNSRRVWGFGGYYLGIAPTIEQANELNRLRREHP